MSQRETYEVLPSQSLPYDIEKLVAKLIYQELRFARKQEDLKHELKKVPKYNLQTFFEEVDKAGQKFIDRNNLKSFLLRYSFIPNDNLVLAIIRRMDLDCDAKLSLMEFIEAVRPVEDQPTARLKSAQARSFRKSASSMSRTPIKYYEQASLTGNDLSRAPESTSNAYKQYDQSRLRRKSSQTLSAATGSRAVRTGPSNKRLRVKPAANKTIYSQTKENFPNSFENTTSLKQMPDVG